MKSFFLLLFAFLFCLVVSITACQREYSYEAVASQATSAQNPDAALSDTTVFIDFLLDGKREFHISYWNADWLPTHGWNSPLPDTTFYPNSGIKAGLLKRHGDTTTSDYSTAYRPAFYLLKNSYGLTMGTFRPIDTSYAPPREIVSIVKRDFLDTFLKTGMYPYATSLNRDTAYRIGPDPSRSRTLLSLGIQLTWRDSTGRNWQTTKGSGNQQGSYFRIVSSKIHDIPFNPHLMPAAQYSSNVLLTAEFACMLYDDTGHQLSLTNGKCRLETYNLKDY